MPAHPADERPHLGSVVLKTLENLRNACGVIIQVGAMSRAERPHPHVFVEPRKISSEPLWMRHVDYAFEISPRGSGFDCHRTWEAILLRTIPIVRTSYVDPLYDGFPVVIVSDWREITPAAMAAWREQWKDGFTAEMFERLTLAHWLTRIHSAAGRTLPISDRRSGVAVVTGSAMSAAP